jgi:2-oxoglutarate ferredoxin oxidoreductase subunit alpha
VSSLHLRYINPLPPGLKDIFSGFNHVFVVEMNDEGLGGYGQLGAVLRARFTDPRIRGLNKVEGITFKVREIVERMKHAISNSTDGD